MYRSDTSTPCCASDLGPPIRRSSRFWTTPDRRPLAPEKVRMMTSVLGRVSKPDCVVQPPTQTRPVPRAIEYYHLPPSPFRYTSFPHHYRVTAASVLRQLPLHHCSDLSATSLVHVDPLTGCHIILLYLTPPMMSC